MRRLACCVLLALTACSAEPKFVFTDHGKVVAPSPTAAPVGEAEVIWMLLPNRRGNPPVAWFLVVRPQSDGTARVEFGEREDPLGPLVHLTGTLDADDYQQLWAEVEGQDVWSLPRHPPGAVLYRDPYSLGVQALVQRDGQVFHHQKPFGCRVQTSPLKPSDDERQRFVGFVDTVRAVAKKAAIDPVQRSQ